MSRDEAIQTMSVVILAEVGNTGAQEELEEMDPFRRRCALRMRVVSESLRQAAEEETRVRYRSVAEARRSGLTPIRPPGLERLRPLSRRQILRSMPSRYLQTASAEKLARRWIPLTSHRGNW